MVYKVLKSQGPPGIAETVLDGAGVQVLQQATVSGADHGQADTIANILADRTDGRDYEFLKNLSGRAAAAANGQSGPIKAQLLVHKGDADAQMYTLQGMNADGEASYRAFEAAYVADKTYLPAVISHARAMLALEYNFGAATYFGVKDKQRSDVLAQCLKGMDAAVKPDDKALLAAVASGLASVVDNKTAKTAKTVADAKFQGLPAASQKFAKDQLEKDKE